MTTVDLSWKLRAQKAETAYANAAAEVHMQARQHEGDAYAISDLRTKLQSAELELTQVREELQRSKREIAASRIELEMAWTLAADNPATEEITRLRSELAQVKADRDGILRGVAHLKLELGKAEAENKNLAAIVNKLIALRQKFHKEGILSVADGETFDTLLEKLSSTPSHPGGE